MINVSDFWENIVDRKNCSVLEKIKRDKNPLILWGCGNVGRYVYHYLQRQGINISGILLDIKYVEKEFYGLAIYDICSLNRTYHTYSIVLGHSYYQMGGALKKSCSNICEVYYLTSILYGQTERIPYAFLEEHKEGYQQIFNLLEDSRSRENMCAYLNARINDDAKEIFPCSVDEQASYFRNDVLQVHDDERYVDVGAYDGDSIKSFLQVTDGLYKEIIALEPNADAFVRLSNYVKNEKLLHIKLICKGAWYKEGFLTLQGDEQVGSLVPFMEDDDNTVEVEPLDTICGQHKPITFMKINIFIGLEECLIGAKKVLQSSCPKLAITVGFDEWALLKIPILIKKLQPRYKLYLRYNGGKMPARLVLYAKV